MRGLDVSHHTRISPRGGEIRLSRRSKLWETVDEGDDGEHESDWNSEADAGPSGAFSCSQPDSKEQAAKKHPSSAAQQSGEYGSDARNNQCNDYSKDFVAISQLSSLPRGTFFPKPDTTPLLSA
jgi:hypothetical protein